MKLDAFQMVEFGKHWGDSHMLYQDRPVYVEMYHGAGVASIHPNPDKPISKRVSVDELEIFNPETGYYNSVTTKDYPVAIFLSRQPRQQVHRGFSKRNSELAYPQVKEKNVIFLPWANQLYHESYGFHNHKYGNPKEEIDRLIKFRRPTSGVSFHYGDPLRGAGYSKSENPYKNLSPSVALSKNIAAVKSKWGYIILMYRKNPIGFYNEGRVYLNEVASSYREQLEELKIGDIMWN